MKPWAVVPVKSFARAKTRLLHLGDPARADLARQLFEHVVSELIRSDTLAGILVATNGGEVAALAEQRGCHVLRDVDAAAAAAPVAGRARHGLVVDAALAHLAAPARDAAGAGASGPALAALVLMADLPRLAASEIAALASALDDHDVVIAPDRHELGTNALGLRLPPPMPTSFGYADSFRRHLDDARARGLRIAVQHSPGLGFDVDVPGDYQALFG